MAQPKRKLGIPIYDTRDVPGGVIDDDSVIDAEVIEPGPSFNERLRQHARGGAAAASESIRNIRENGVRDAFFTQHADQVRQAAGVSTPGMREREHARRARRAQGEFRQERAASAKRARQERSRLEREAGKDPMKRLRLNIAQAGEAYMSSLRMSGVLASGETKGSQRAELSGLHQIYASMMVLQCVEPLKQGMDSKNVVKAMGMAASMWMLSPEFRTQMGMFAERVGDAVRGKITAREEAKDSRARERLQKLTAVGKGDQLAARWRKRLDRIEHAERGHRLPFTAQSAAMTEVALAEAAYADMRLPGADVDGIQQRYRTAMSALYDYVQDDGIDPAEVSQAMRIIVGQRLDNEPQLANVFGELGHGRFTKGLHREVYINGTAETAIAWTGDFVDAFGGRTITSGSFSLRPVATMDEHRLRASETLAAELTNVTDVSEMNEVFSHYMSAAVVGKFPGVVEEITDRNVAARFGRVRTMFSSMSDDGLSAEEQRFAYSAAYVDAVEVMQQINPELGQAWVAQHGDNWREKVAEQVHLYTRMGETAERRDRFGETGEPRDFTASSPGRSARDGGEDIVDADVVEDDAAAAARPDAPAARRRLEQMVYEGDLLPAEESNLDEVVIDGEVVEVAQVSAGRRHLALSARGATAAGGVATKTARARVNQHYNDVDTGGILGIGSDDAAPLQDPGFQLG